MGALTGFFIAVAAVSSIVFVLMLRSDRVRGRRRAYADSTAGDTGGMASGDGGLSLLNWFNGSSSSSDDSCASSPSSFSSSDSSCGDGGGGDGGGGGGD